MEAGNRKKRIIVVFTLVIFVTVLLCFAAGKSREEMPDEKTAVSEAETAGVEVASDSVESGKDTPGTEEKDFSEAEDAEGDSSEEEPAFGRGIESEETLSEDVVLALKNGDTESLVGVAFGEQFDYDLYESWGENKYHPKEVVYDWYLSYLFDGAGHRFSGFSISSSGESFLGLNLKNCPASVFIKAFGEPDCEKIDYVWEEGIVSADWYFEKAVLTVEEYKGYVREIEYKALGDIADGDGTEIKSDYELWKETRSENEKVEAPYVFDEWEEVYYPSEDGGSDAQSVDEFVENFLREWGFENQAPDSVIYDEEGQKFAESYVDGEQEKCCFIVYDGKVGCTAGKNPREDDETWRIVYSCDKNGNTVHETLYDKWGMRASEASYRYHDGIPFPFITENWNVKYEGIYRFCRGQKTWFYEERVKSDKKGRVKEAIEIEEWNTKEYLYYPCFFTYSSDGKLKRIQEEIPQEMFEEDLWDIREHYFGYMEFSYDNGVLNKIDYDRSGQFYGTTDESGTIDFDEQGRMAHNYYYVTSGCHDEFYFYHGDEKRPWAILDWCHDIWSVGVYLPVEEV